MMVHFKCSGLWHGVESYLGEGGGVREDDDFAADWQAWDMDMDIDEINIHKEF